MAIRSAIADKLGNSSINITKDENLTRLLDSFHRAEGHLLEPFPGLSQLTKGPFEPLKEAFLKHLTFKTVFLLALDSDIHLGNIHAWQNNQASSRLV